MGFYSIEETIPSPPLNYCHLHKILDSVAKNLKFCDFLGKTKQ